MLDMARSRPAQLTFRAVHEAEAEAEARGAAREARRRRGGRPKKPAGERGVPHAPRPAHSFRHPVHVTVRLVPGVVTLRDKKLFRMVRKVLQAASVRFGQMFRIVEYSVQSNHLHLIVESQNRRELSRGMQGFGIRLAKNLNLRLQRKGTVLNDRYHARPLRSPTQTRNALEYVRRNVHHHAHRAGQRTSWNTDPCSTDHEPLRTALPAPETHFLQRARAAFS